MTDFLHTIYVKIALTLTGIGGALGLVSTPLTYNDVSGLHEQETVIQEVPPATQTTISTQDASALQEEMQNLKEEVEKLKKEKGATVPRSQPAPVVPKRVTVPVVIQPEVSSGPDLQGIKKCMKKAIKSGSGDTSHCFNTSSTYTSPSPSYSPPVAAPSAWVQMKERERCNKDNGLYYNGDCY